MTRLLTILVLSCAASAGPTLTVRATDAASGVPLDGLKCGLVDKAGVVRASNFPAAYAGKRPTAGDVLYVYRRGYHLAKVRLDGTETTVSVALDRTDTRSSTVRIEGAGPAARWWLQVFVQAEGRWKKGPIEDRYRIEVTGHSQVVRYGAGTRCGVFVFGVHGLIWPMRAHLRAGREFVCSWERQRKIALRGKNLHAAAFVVDLLNVPAIPPERIDAWLWHMKAPWWLSNQISEDRKWLHLYPDVRFHVFATPHGLPAYRYVTANVDQLDFTAQPKVRMIQDVPLLDGRPLRPGTRLAVGKLDIIALHYLDQCRVSGCVMRVPKRWQPVRFASANWLTAWHTETGLSHFAWEPDRRPTTRSYPGAIVVSTPAGSGLRGRASVFTTWRGSGRVRGGPADKELSRSIGEHPTRFRGLPPGRYAIAFGLSAKGKPKSLEHTVEATITAEEPVVRLVLAPPK